MYLHSLVFKQRHELVRDVSAAKTVPCGELTTAIILLSQRANAGKWQYVH